MQHTDTHTYSTYISMTCKISNKQHKIHSCSRFIKQLWIVTRCSSSSSNNSNNIWNICSTEKSTVWIWYCVVWLCKLMPIKMYDDPTNWEWIVFTQRREKERKSKRVSEQAIKIETMKLVELYYVVAQSVSKIDLIYWHVSLFSRIVSVRPSTCLCACVRVNLFYIWNALNQARAN